MGDLVLLRDLIKSPARGQSVDLDVLFRHLSSDTLFECIIARAVSPFAADAVARAFHFLGVRPAASCADVATSLRSFTRRYSRRAISVLRVDVAPNAFGPFHREMGKVYPYSKSISSSSAVALQPGASDRATRPVSIVHGRRIEHSRATRLSRSDTSSVRKLPYATARAKSPKVTLSISAEPSQGRSDALSFSTTGLRPEFPPPMSESDEESPAFAHSDGECDAFSPSGVPLTWNSVVSSQDTRIRKLTSGQALKARLLELAQNFAEKSGLLLNLRNSGVGNERVSELVIEAVMQHCKSVSSTRLAVKNAEWLVRRFIDTSNTGNLIRNWWNSTILTHDYIEQSANRGGTTPVSIKHSLTCRAAALQIDWRLDHSLISSASVIEANVAPRHAAPMALGAVKLIDGIATNPEVTPP